MVSNELNDEQYKKMVIQKSNNNHFFKESMIKKWVDKENKILIIEKNELGVTKSISHNKTNKIFTSRIINKNTEGQIVNQIENDFENSIKELVQNNGKSFIDKNIPKYLDEKIKEHEVKKEKKFKELLPDYICLQIMRSPYYLFIYQSNISAHPDFNEITKDEKSLLMYLGFNDIKNSIFRDHFLKNREIFKNVSNYHVFSNEDNVYNCSDVSTINIDVYLSVICKAKSITKHKNIINWMNNFTDFDLKKVFLSVISPNVLLLIDFNEKNDFVFNKIKNKIIENIISDWNNFSFILYFDKMILANNRQLFSKQVLECKKEITKDNKDMYDCYFKMKEVMYLIEKENIETPGDFLEYLNFQDEVVIKHLTEKEIAFIEALRKDKETNGDNSFLEILWQGIFPPEKELRKELKKNLNVMFKGYENLFKNSDLILQSIDGVYIGKYKDIFWSTGSDGQVYGMGKEIQNIVFPFIYTYYGDVIDSESKLEVENYFKHHLKLDYDKYMQSYRDFCFSLGYEYKEDWDLMNRQSKEFERELPSLE